MPPTPRRPEEVVEAEGAEFTSVAVAVAVHRISVAVAHRISAAVVAHRTSGAGAEAHRIWGAEAECASAARLMSVAGRL